MTKRAILWCGHVRRPIPERDAWGLPRKVEDPLVHTDDFRIQMNGLELAFRAARALGVENDEIHACLVRPDLAPQELRTEVLEATVAGLQRLVRNIAWRPDDALLFVAVNHGDRRGFLTTSDAVDEFDDRSRPHLTPEVLDSCLCPVMGPLVIVIATCFAGAFLPLALDPRRTVVAACSATEEYRVLREDGSCSAFLDELFGAWCGVTHSDAIPAAHLPLDEAFVEAKRRLAMTTTLNVPLYAGTNTWR